MSSNGPQSSRGNIAKAKLLMAKHGSDTHPDSYLPKNLEIERLLGKLNDIK